MTRVLDFNLTPSYENVAWNGTAELRRSMGKSTAFYTPGNGVEHQSEVSEEIADYLESVAGTNEGKEAIIYYAVGR